MATPPKKHYDVWTNEDDVWPVLQRDQRPLPQVPNDSRSNHRPSLARSRYRGRGAEGAKRSEVVGRENIVIAFGLLASIFSIGDLQMGSGEQDRMVRKLLMGRMPLRPKTAREAYEVGSATMSLCCLGGVLSDRRSHVSRRLETAIAAERSARSYGL